MLFGGNLVTWTIVTTAAALVLLWRRNLYRALEIGMMVLVGVMVLAFAVTAFMSGPKWGGVASGFVPDASLITSNALLLLALLSSNIEIYTSPYSAYVTREKGTPVEQYRATTLTDTLAGSLIPKVILVLTAIAAATAMGGRSVFSPGEVASVLGPILGPLGPIVFGVGILAAGFTSVMGNATAGGAILSDTMGWETSLGSVKVKTVGTAVMVVGALVIAIAGGQPVGLLIAMNGALAFGLPVLGATILVVGNSKRLNSLRNKVWQNVVGVITLLVIVGGSVLLVQDVLGGLS